MPRAAFGKMNTFEHTSKLLAIAQKTATGAEFGWVVAGIYSEMLRSDTADVGTKADFTAKAGHIQLWLFLRKLLFYMKKRLLYRPSSDEEASLMQKAWELTDDPVSLCAKQGDDVNLTLGLPDFMLRAMNFLQGCMVGKHNETLKGSLAGSMGPLQVESFLEAGSVKSVWSEIESSLAKANGEPEERTPATEQEKSKAEQAKQKQQEKQDSLKVLQADALEEAERLHDQRSVLLVPDTDHPVSALLDGQTLVKLGNRMLGFFDCKNHGLARVYAGQNCFQRVPCLKHHEPQVVPLLQAEIFLLLLHCAWLRFPPSAVTISRPF